MIGFRKVAEWAIWKKLAISNSFEVAAHWVSQSSDYSVMLWPTGANFHCVIAYPKVAEWAI